MQVLQGALQATHSNPPGVGTAFSFFVKPEAQDEHPVAERQVLH